MQTQLIKSNLDSCVKAMLRQDQRVTKNYNTLVETAIQLMQAFARPEHRTYCLMDHSKNEFNTNMIQELLCYFWNITLQVDPHNGRRQIVIDLGKEGLVEFGSKCTTNLLSKAFRMFSTKCLAPETHNCLLINYPPMELSSYYYRVIAQGETHYVTINSIDRLID